MRSWLVPTTLASLLAIGLPYWLTPYRALNLPDQLFPGVLLAAACAAGLVACSMRAGKVIASLGATAPAAVWLRVVADTLRDPGSHNLWPLEMLIAMLAGGSCVTLGALAGLVLRRLRRA